MGAQKDIGLFIYAEKFVEAGMAVLAFDYRCSCWGQGALLAFVLLLGISR
jgi:hypothetical protein